MHILIGACGLNHEQWIGQFYPDDMPDDWRLSYYANEFEALLLPFSVWSTFDIGEIESWLEDVPNEFNLYFEVDSKVCNPTVKKMLSHDLFSQRQVEFSSFASKPLSKNCTLKQGAILEYDSHCEKKAALKIYAEDVINNEEIRQVIERVQEEYHGFNTLCLFFDQALLDIGLMNTTKIIVDLMVDSDK